MRFVIVLINEHDDDDDDDSHTYATDAWSGIDRNYKVGSEAKPVEYFGPHFYNRSYTPARSSFLILTGCGDGD